MGWLNEVLRLSGWVDAGYPLDPSQVTAEQMDALAEIKRWQREQEAEEWRKQQ